MNSSLRLIATGGTFDKIYLPQNGLLGFTETCLPALLAQARLEPQTTLEVAMLVDSLDMTPAQRAQLVARCQSASESQLVIIHGTDTMIESAGAIAQALASEGTQRTIVLTGAMVPARIEGSDALFNLGFALAAARLLPGGVWIAMHGTIWPWDSVQKNRSAGRFETRD